ncbi:MAG: transcription antitermination factor NusB [Bryobacter sp.]|nr:transcription antitermination factor NusB [Bryobacter sp.]
MPMISAARKAAYEALRRVQGGGHSDLALLDTCLGLEPRDAALAHQIVYGVLRRWNQLAWLAKHFSGRKVFEVDTTTAILLYMGIFQLRFLARIPPHAAVMESVELAKRANKRAAAGLVNAILRKVNKKPLPWPDEATEVAMPEWLWKKWKRELGAETARMAALASLEEPRTKGMDAGAQTIVPHLEIEPGNLLLDLCAAPGNKARQASEAGARVIACDRSGKRLAGMREMGFPLVQLDAAQALPFRPVFARVLADVPCSGTGTLARNPEIKWRLTPEDLLRQQERQIAILRNAAGVLAPGGRLVYSTCSLEKEENEEVVAAVFPNAGTAMHRRTPGCDPGDGFFAAVIPVSA